MNKTVIFKRLYNQYTSKFIIKIVLAALLSVLVAISTSATAWLLDPAIEKIFINKDQTLIILIPFAIILAFTTKGISLYFAKLIMINVGEEVKKIIQIDMLKSFIKADTEMGDRLGLLVGVCIEQWPNRRVCTREVRGRPQGGHSKSKVQ